MDMAFHRNQHQQNYATKNISNAPKNILLPEDANDRIARYTWWLAILTGALVVVSGIQGYFLLRADKTARLMAETAQTQATKMGEWAEIAEKQMLLTGQQADIQLKQHAIGRLQFFATHRPEITVHAIEFLRAPGKDVYECIGASILCFNKGPTRADNVEVRGDILPTTTVSIDVQRRLIKTFDQVGSGQKLRFAVTSEWEIRELAVRMRQAREQGPMGTPFYCVGTISYFDQNTVFDQPIARRETGFCFKLTVDATGERWISAKSPEHEYSF